VGKTKGAVAEMIIIRTLHIVLELSVQVQAELFGNRNKGPLAKL
jgi:hypothetical protein